MVLRAAHYAKKLKQFSPKASLCKSTFLSFDSENKILILNISWKRKITFLNFTWYTHFAFASNFTFESNFAMLSNFAISNARHMPFARHMPSARRTTSARHMPFHVICHLLVLLLIKNDLRAKRYKWIIICRERRTSPIIKAKALDGPREPWCFAHKMIELRFTRSLGAFT